MEEEWETRLGEEVSVQNEQLSVDGNVTDGDGAIQENEDTNQVEAIPTEETSQQQTPPSPPALLLSQSRSLPPLLTSHPHNSHSSPSSQSQPLPFHTVNLPITQPIHAPTLIPLSPSTNSYNTPTPTPSSSASTLLPSPNLSATLHIPTPRRTLRPPSSISSLSLSLTPSPPPPPPLTPSETTLLHLPNEVLDQILRQTSARPRQKRPMWETMTQQSNAMSFALTCQRFLLLFRQHLVVIRTRGERFRDDGMAKLADHGVVIDQRTERDDNHLKAVIRLAGPFLKEVRAVAGNWMRELGNVERLFLRDVGEGIDLSRVESVKELEIVGRTGGGLSQGQLRMMENCRLERFCVRLSVFNGDWEGVWKCMMGVKRLSIGATRFWIMDEEEEELLEMVGKWCTNVEELHFYHVGPALGGGVVKLKRALKGLKRLELEQCQLERRDVRGLNDVDVWIVHGSSLNSSGYNSDIVEILGKNVKGLRYKSQLAHDDSLGMIAEKCIGLRELRLDCASVVRQSVLEGILRRLRGELRVLSLSFFVRGVQRADVEGVLKVCSEVCEELTEFHIGGRVWNGDDFARVVTRCKSSLEKVGATFGYVAGGRVLEKEQVESILRAATECTRLKSLIVTDRTGGDVANAETRTLARRIRGERVNVCGIEYAV